MVGSTPPDGDGPPEGGSLPRPAGGVRGRTLLVLALAGLVSIAAGLVGLLVADRGRDDGPGGPFTPFRAPAVRLPELRDPSQTVDLADLRGRPVVLNFFFSDCRPCVAELPRFEAEHRRLGAGVAVVGIDHFEPRAAGLQLVRRTGITFPVGWDRLGEVARRFGITAFPATVFVDDRGIVRARVLGSLSSDRLRAQIETLLQQSS